MLERPPIARRGAPPPVAAIALGLPNPTMTAVWRGCTCGCCGAAETAVGAGPPMPPPRMIAVCCSCATLVAVSRTAAWPIGLLAWCNRSRPPPPAPIPPIGLMLLWSGDAPAAAAVPTPAAVAVVDDLSLRTPVTVKEMLEPTGENGNAVAAAALLPPPAPPAAATVAPWALADDAAGEVQLLLPPVMTGLAAGETAEAAPPLTCPGSPPGPPVVWPPPTTPAPADEPDKMSDEGTLAASLA